MSGFFILNFFIHPPGNVYTQQGICITKNIFVKLWIGGPRLKKVLKRGKNVLHCTFLLTYFNLIVYLFWLLFKFVNQCFSRFLAVKTISGNHTSGFKAKKIDAIHLSNEFLAFSNFHDIQYILRPFTSKYLSLFIQWSQEQPTR